MERGDVERAFDEGRRAWPNLSLELGQFRRYLRRALGEAPSWDWRAHAAELYLSCACAAGDPLAHEAFEQTYFPDVEAVIERIDADRGFVAAVLSSLRARLFTGSARVFMYAARGSLGAWLSVFAARVALNTVRERVYRTVSARNLS